MFPRRLFFLGLLKASLLELARWAGCVATTPPFRLHGAGGAVLPSSELASLRCVGLRGFPTTR